MLMKILLWGTSIILRPKVFKFTELKTQFDKQTNLLAKATSEYSDAGEANDYNDNNPSVIKAN